MMEVNKEIQIGKHTISKNSPTYIVAEMSANHNMDFNRAKAIIEAAKNLVQMQLKFKHIHQTQLRLIVICLHLKQKEYGKEERFMSYMEKRIHHGNGRKN